MPPKKKGKAPAKQLDAPLAQGPQKNEEQHQEEASAVKLPDDEETVRSPIEVPKAVQSEQDKGTDTPRSSRSWYGAWGKKSRDSVVLSSDPEVLQSNIESKANSPATRPMNTPAKRAPLLSPASSGRSVPLLAMTTKLNISSEGSKGTKEIEKDRQHLKGTHVLKEAESTGTEAKAAQQKEPGNQGINSKQATKTTDDGQKQTQPGIATPTSWLSWGKGDRPVIPSISLSSTPTKDKDLERTESTSATGAGQPVPKQENSAANVITASNTESSASSSWYPRWVIGASTPTTIPSTGISEPDVLTQPMETIESANEDPPNKSTTMSEAKRSNWAFWSSSTGQGDDAKGQLAVADSFSQSKPEPAVVREGSPVLTADDKKKRPLSQGEEPAKKKQAASMTNVAQKMEEKPTQQTSNMLLPNFESTYSASPHPTSIWQQIGSWIYSNQLPKHPTLLKEPRKIKHALAIGVHGYFPAAIVQSVIGKPTGTSIKFADSAAKAIEDFTQKYGYSPQSIDKIALEGEGRIDERLNILWKLLLNWIDMIRKADFILLACHSQGVPVAISLVAKLIGFGCVSEARIGICAMAGISRGPFAEYKSRWIAGSAAELFEFSDPTSSVSRAYREALETVLRFGVKILFVGSLDDQLVPLHSSTHTNVDHPNIYRAVFIDGRIHVSDFICHLVGFALKLRNLSTSDHGLIRELSNPLAGSLMGGEGHSRIYDEAAVYNLAMDFTLRTNDVSGSFQYDDTPLPLAVNPFVLPFVLSRVLEEEVVRTQLSDEVVDLLKQFDKWKPSTKQLKDVKYRIEGVRSKL